MSILIKNVQVIDGTGKPSVKADVLIKKNKISAVENFINYKADETIDGFGYYLAPGFIDINNHQDRYLNIFPTQAESNIFSENFLLQGVTTIIGGSNGISLSPLAYGSLDFLKPWANMRNINVDWHSIYEFLKSIKKLPLKANFGTFVGFNAVYQEIIKERKEENLTVNESKILNFILKEALNDGAFGVSIDLGGAKISDISYFEIRKIAGLTKKIGRLFGINLKDNQNNSTNSVKKAIYLAKESKAKLLISNLFPFFGMESQYEEAIGLIGKKIKNANIYFDFPISGEIILDIADFLPKRLRAINRKAVVENLKNSDFKLEILKEIPKPTGEEIIFPSPSIKSIIGKSLKEFSENRNLDFKNGLVKLMEITGLRAGIIVKNINQQHFYKALSLENSLISSNSVPPYSNVFKKFLKFAENENIIPIEEAIKKITFLPAKILDIEGRGEIKSGYFADLAVFKGGEIKDVILNGKIVVKDGQCNKISAGIPLSPQNSNFYV